MASQVTGPCARATTLAVIVSRAGAVHTGSNAVNAPQSACPRGELPTGQGYELCREVCRQPDHAEKVACRTAGPDAHGATLVLLGHSYICRDCQSAMDTAGIAESLILGPLGWLGPYDPVTTGLDGFQVLLAALDQCVTQKTWSSVLHPAAQRRVTPEQLLFERSEPLYYLADGGYSRIFFSETSLTNGEPCLHLTSESREEVNERWNAPSAQTLRRLLDRIIRKALL